MGGDSVFCRLGLLKSSLDYLDEEIDHDCCALRRSLCRGCLRWMVWEAKAGLPWRGLIKGLRVVNI